MTEIAEKKGEGRVSHTAALYTANDLLAKTNKPHVYVTISPL